MTDKVIVAENISKRYRLGIEGPKETTLTGQIMKMVKSPVNNLKRLSNLSNFEKEEQSVFWALRNVNFDVKRGEVLGIIGKNGAGKSTLLKILSRITDPTDGQIQIKGRISALLEVGTGFHPELTGRENVYMNGTILGMRKREIDEKLEEIIAFSGVSQHVDTPVKFYSSGMKVRLGFSVAAHLEPEILIIDEVLSVGDLDFQRKCLGKMENVAKSGRTVLFVSHSMSAIRHMCTRCLVLNQGSIEFDGTVDGAIQAYISQNVNSDLSTSYQKIEVSSSPIELISAQILDSNKRLKGEFNADEDITLLLICRKNEMLPGIQGYLLVRNEADEIFIESDTFDYLPNVLDQLPVGEHTLELQIPRRVLPKGRFKVYLNFTSNFSTTTHNIDSPMDILLFEIYDTTTARGVKRRALTNTIVEWKTIKV